MTRKVLLLTIFAAAALFVSCSGEEKGQVILTVASINPASEPFGDTMSSNGTIPGDAIDIELNSDLKNPGGLSSLTWADVIIESITVSFNRIDGGSDKPQTFRSAVSYKVPAQGVLTIEGFAIVPATMKGQFPISDLIFYGYERSTNYISIKCDVIVEFDGKTIEGDRVYAKGQISIEFTNWAD
ncbi:MAG TPA: hypothetical protein VMX35_02395 [Acidobacteriota bacterium]|nr:hypothetical protein [Acidobacteriota bacterium]